MPWHSRLVRQALDYDATQADILALFQRFRALLDTRGLVVSAFTFNNQFIRAVERTAPITWRKHPRCARL